jgi:hypothetical protein
MQCPRGQWAATCDGISSGWSNDASVVPNKIAAGREQGREKQVQGSMVGGIPDCSWNVASASSAPARSGPYALLLRLRRLREHSPGWWTTNSQLLHLHPTVALRVLVNENWKVKSVVEGGGGSKSCASHPNPPRVVRGAVAHCKTATSHIRLCKPGHLTRRRRQLNPGGGPLHSAAAAAATATVSWIAMETSRTVSPSQWISLQ